MHPHFVVFTLSDSKSISMFNLSCCFASISTSSAINLVSKGLTDTFIQKIFSKHYNWIDFYLFAPLRSATGPPLAQNKKVGRMSLENILPIWKDVNHSFQKKISHCLKGFKYSILSQQALAKAKVSGASTKECLSFLRWDSTARQGPDHSVKTSITNSWSFLTGFITMEVLLESF